MPFCTNCGFQNPEGSNFCARCGSALTKAEGTAQPDTRTEPEGAETGTVLNSPVSAGETTSSIPVVAEEPLASFGALSNDEEEAIESLPAGSGLLIVHRGPAAGARYLLDSDLHTAGRSPDSDIFLDDITVSRHHVEFSRTERGIAVRDVGSLNGTYVNRTLIDGDIILKPGDEVQIGKFRMVYFAQRPGD